jgi:hypothetical protein
MKAVLHGTGKKAKNLKGSCTHEYIYSLLFCDVSLHAYWELRGNIHVKMEWAEAESSSKRREEKKEHT